jgi:hypothetical protein
MPKAWFPQLPTTLLLWLADMVVFSYDNDDDALERVQQLGGYKDENIPPQFFNENYFTAEEALCLLRLKVKNSRCKTFRSAFRGFIDERSHNNKAQVCTSSEVVPFLCKTLRIEPYFSSDKKFKRDYQAFRKEWKKAKRVNTIALGFLADLLYYIATSLLQVKCFLDTGVTTVHNNITAGAVRCCSG